jgi:hypothetical protein
MAHRDDISVPVSCAVTLTFVFTLVFRDGPLLRAEVSRYGSNRNTAKTHIHRKMSKPIPRKKDFERVAGRILPLIRPPIQDESRPYFANAHLIRWPCCPNDENLAWDFVDGKCAVHPSGKQRYW